MNLKTVLFLLYRDFLSFKGMITYHSYFGSPCRTWVYKVIGLNHLILSIGYPVSSIRFQVLVIKYRMSSIIYQVLFTGVSIHVTNRSIKYWVSGRTSSISAGNLQ